VTVRAVNCANDTSAHPASRIAEASLAQFTALTVTGSPAPFVIATATAGLQPASITNSVTSYFVKAKNAAGPQKISAHLNAPMPAGTTITLRMAPSSGATSLGPVVLDMTSRDIVVNIAKENGSTLPITYVFSATVAAGVIPLQTRTVTLTLSAYP
jgi:hypothetical protein